MICIVDDKEKTGEQCYRCLWSEKSGHKCTHPWLEDKEVLVFGVPTKKKKRMKTRCIICGRWFYDLDSFGFEGLMSLTCSDKCKKESDKNKRVIRKTMISSTTPRGDRQK